MNIKILACIGSRFNYFSTNGEWFLEVMFNGSITSTTMDVTLEGLRVDNWQIVGGKQYLDTVNLIYEVDDRLGYHFWVDIPLRDSSLIAIGPLRSIPLHAAIDTVPEPLIGWAGFRVTINYMEGYRITSIPGSRAVFNNDWAAFFSPTPAGSGLRGNWVGF